MNRLLLLTTLWMGLLLPSCSFMARQSIVQQANPWQQSAESPENTEAAPAEEQDAKELPLPAPLPAESETATTPEKASDAESSSPWYYLGIPSLFQQQSQELTEAEAEQASADKESASKTSKTAAAEESTAATSEAAAPQEPAVSAPTALPGTTPTPLPSVTPRALPSAQDYLRSQIGGPSPTPPSDEPPTPTVAPNAAERRGLRAPSLPKQLPLGSNGMLPAL